MTQKTIKLLWVGLLLAFGFWALLFVAMPGIDINVSSAFYREIDGFWLADDRLLSAYRSVFNALSISLAVMSLILWVVAYWRGPVFGIYDRVWAFITLLYVIGPVLLVNGFFKSVFGRARPADIEVFGGGGVFSRAFELSDQCQSNCSFVSGEGSSATAFAISIFVLSRSVPNKTTRYLMVGLGLAASVIATTLRILKGRHFLSDTVFSVLFVSLVALLLCSILFRRPNNG